MTKSDTLVFVGAVSLLVAGLAAGVALEVEEVDRVSNCETTGETQLTTQINSCGTNCVYTTNVQMFKYACSDGEYWSHVSPARRGAR